MRSRCSEGPRQGCLALNDDSGADSLEDDGILDRNSRFCVGARFGRCLKRVFDRLDKKYTNLVTPSHCGFHSSNVDFIKYKSYKSGRFLNIQRQIILQ